MVRQLLLEKFNNKNELLLSMAQLVLKGQTLHIEFVGTRFIIFRAINDYFYYKYYSLVIFNYETLGTIILQSKVMFSYNNKYDMNDTCQIKIYETEDNNKLLYTEKFSSQNDLEEKLKDYYIKNEIRDLYVKSINTYNNFKNIS